MEIVRRECDEDGETFVEMEASLRPSIKFHLADITDTQPAKPSSEISTSWEKRIYAYFREKRDCRNEKKKKKPHRK